LRGWEQPVDRIVDAMFTFLRDGYLRVDLVPVRSRKAK
jgi:hypothetical protein